MGCTYCRLHVHEDGEIEDLQVGAQARALTRLHVRLRAHNHGLGDPRIFTEAEARVHAGGAIHGAKRLPSEYGNLFVYVIE